MKKIFEFLVAKEKKILGSLCAVLVLVVLFLVLISLPQRKKYFQALSSLTSKEESYQSIANEVQEREDDWLRWQEAREDMDELRAKYFYDEKDVFQQLRLDLAQIFRNAGVMVSRINYNYAEMKKEKIKKVNVSFNLKGSYVLLKSFIHSVEVFPKFLVIEKIDFLNIDTTRGDLELKVVLAGYYES